MTRGWRWLALVLVAASGCKESSSPPGPTSEGRRAPDVTPVPVSVPPTDDEFATARIRAEPIVGNGWECAVFVPDEGTLELYSALRCTIATGDLRADLHAGTVFTGTETREADAKEACSWPGELAHDAWISSPSSTQTRYQFQGGVAVQSAAYEGADAGGQPSRVELETASIGAGYSSCVRIFVRGNTERAHPEVVGAWKRGVAFFVDDE